MQIPMDLFANIPQETSSYDHQARQIKHVINKLNNRPGKIFGIKTRNQVFFWD